MSGHRGTAAARIRPALRPQPPIGRRTPGLPGATLLLFAAAALLPTPAPAQDATGTGVSTLLVTRDGPTLTLALSGPPENFIGDQSPPDSGQRGELVRSAAALLRDAGSMFHTTLAAGCRVARVELRGQELAAAEVAGVFEPDAERSARIRSHGDPDTDESDGEPGAEPPSEHPADSQPEFRIDYRYECTRPEALRELTVQLFITFPGTREIDARITTPGGQRDERLSPANPMLSLAEAH